MKNNHGWSFREMLVFMIIFIIIFIIISIRVHAFYKNTIKDNNDNKLIINDFDDDNSDSKDINDSSYAKLEQKFVDAAIKYFDENNISENTEITKSMLIDNNYLTTSDLLDIKDKTPCDGKVIVEFSNDVINYKPYLICSNYETDKETNE